ncbi:26S proteasome non-ATPase regulatory subunit 10-like [Anopheles bellator]|uniref:26S proteasome non-ATPase regulatory subunit 10-like n=1 Tax=Anopheles bellator TaxID=139047 RepID=UPI0026483845|nr:26S proteasome non-ATPase regulatory subunit 10-like [Anopheles bellator]XP_058064052.1 26S proteasome non-ATPase regulatory subunit 10-like [Anopheles bellator]XP_058064053.1 26S proteasome non-ATPase regulatory subunit 10-like [Anopheles bellator]
MNITTLFYELVRKDLAQIYSTLSSNLSLTTDKDENERLLLHWAAMAGQETLVDNLLRQHPNQYDAEDDSKITPLILAAQGGHLNIVTKLVARGANINQRNARGHSALQYACSKGYIEIAEFLLDTGADVNILDHLNETPLHRAIVMGREAIVQLLLARGANMMIANTAGNTPLHLACDENQKWCAIALLRRGASRNVLNRDGVGPLELAQRSLLNAIANEVDNRSAG